MLVPLEDGDIFHSLKRCVLNKIRGGWMSRIVIVTYCRHRPIDRICYNYYIAFHQFAQYIPSNYDYMIIQYIRDRNLH
jgi:hypothetical protein